MAKGLSPKRLKARYSQATLRWEGLSVNGPTVDLPTQLGDVLLEVTRSYNAGMNALLQQAVEKLQEMPEERQELLARLVLHEIQEDRLWKQSTEQHSEKLSQFVAEVLAEDERGECEDLNDVDSL